MKQTSNIHLLTIYSSIKDATSFYRGYGLISYMEKHFQCNDYNIKVINRPTYGNSWHELADIDVIYIQRPSTPQYLPLFRLAKKMNIPIIVDYDDNELFIPEYNLMYNHYKDCIGNILYYLNNAHTVISSTNTLASYYSRYCRKCIVINNSIDMMYHYFSDKKINRTDYLQRRKKNFKPTILIRGGANHLYDLMHFKSEIINISKMNLNMVILGYDPIVTTELSDAKFEYIDWEPLHNYYELLTLVDPDIILVPLIDNDYNRCISRNAYNETYYLGTRCIGPLFNEWILSGIENYDSANPITLEQAVQAIINSENIFPITEDKTSTKLHENAGKLLTIIEATYLRNKQPNDSI